MKRILNVILWSFAILLALPTEAFAYLAKDTRASVVENYTPAGDPVMSFKSKRGARAAVNDRYMQIYFKSSVADTAYVVVDDTTYAYSMDGKTTPRGPKIYLVKPDVKVKIYGKNIWFVNINSTDAYDLEMGEDGKSNITELRCEANLLTSLDFVNDMKALNYLVTSKLQGTDINIKSESLERVQLGQQPNVKNLTVEGSKIYEFKFEKNNGVKSLDLTKIPLLKTLYLSADSALEKLTFCDTRDNIDAVTISYSQLKDMDFTNFPKLRTLAVYSNESLQSIKVENCPTLNSLNVQNNALKALSLKDLPKLTTITATGNPLESLDLDLAALTSFTYKNNATMKSMDFSKTPKMRTLYLQDGVLENIKLSHDAVCNSLSAMYVTGNNFGLVNLPARGKKQQASTSYTKPYNYYAPQKNPVIPATLKVGDTVDLSKYLYGNKYAADSTLEKVPSVYKWITKFDEELQEGVDYTAKDGVFTFLKEQEDSIACFITNSEFFWFKLDTTKTTSGEVINDYRIMTNYASVAGAADNTVLSFKSARGTRAAEKDRYVQVNLKTTIPGSVAYVIVDGDSTAVELKKANSITASSKITVSKPSVDVKIVGDSIWFVNMSDMNATDVTIGEAGKELLTEFWCQKNPIESLDFVNGMKNLTYLNIAQNAALKDVNIVNNSLQKVKCGVQRTIESFNIESKNLSVFDLSENNKITRFDFTKCPVMTELSLTKDSAITSLTLGTTDLLQKLTLSFTQLESLAAKNMPALKTLSVYENYKLTDVQIENCPAATTILLRDNALKSFTLKDMPALTGLTLTGNPLETLDLDLKALTSLTCKETKLKTVDLSKLPKVRSAYFNDGGQLEHITLSKDAVNNSLANLYLMGNNFGLTDLPARGKKMAPMNKYSTPYNYYAPQKNPVIPETMKVGDAVDLSKYLYGNKYAADSTLEKVQSVYTWMTKFEEELKEGVDYTVKDGVFTFLKEQEDSIACFITNAEFDWFKKYTDTKGVEYDYRLMTNYTTVSAVSGIQGVADGNGKPVVRAGEGREILVANAAGRSITVCDVAGRVVATGTAAGDETIHVAAPGLYIVKVGDECVKMRLK